MLHQFKLTLVLIIYMRLCSESHAASGICNICSCRNSQTNIDCSYFGLPSIPQPIPLNVEHLDLRGNAIKEIQENTFWNMSNLTTLNFWDNAITEIKVGTFHNLSSLTELDLDNNDIKEIKAGTFQTLPSLKTLYLKNNKIEKIEVGAMEDLPSLRTIFLRSNKIKDIEADTFRNLSSLAYLYLGFNDISEIKADTFQDLSSLTLLSLNSNNISEIKADTFRNMSGLTFIDLSDNKINEIQADTFRNLSNLTHLYLRTNRIKEIEADTFRNLSNLKELFLSSNDINEIHVDTFRDLSSLTHLSLSSNNISEIQAETFRNLSSLTHLLLSSNGIKEIKANTFRNLTSLTELNLGGNNINKIKGEIFQNLPSLTTLNLGGNDMKKVKAKMFHYLSSLKTLYLHDNNMTHIERGIFYNLRNLERLFLNENNIKTIDVTSFNGLSTLRNLYLQNNDIMHIQRDIFENLPNLERLDLRRNRIKSYEDGAFLFLPRIMYIFLSGNKDMMCECHLPALVNYTKKVFNRRVFVFGQCQMDSGNNQSKEIPILKYSQCQNYSLFQQDLKCQTCSGIMCKQPKVVNCTDDEAVCESKLSMNGVTLNLEKSCSTYKQCLQAMRNNTFTCNKWTNNTSCVVCCTGNLCNKNDFIENVEGFSTLLRDISKKSKYFKAEDIDLVVDIQEKMLPLIPDVSVNVTVNNILPSINDMINTPEEIWVEADQSQRTGKRMLDIIEAIPEKIPLEGQQLTAIYSNLGIGVIKVENGTFNGASYGVSFGNKENKAKTMMYDNLDSDRQVNDVMNSISLPKGLLKQLKDEERSTISRITFFSIKDDKLYKVTQDSRTKANTTINSNIIAANVPNIKITNLDDPVNITLNLKDQDATNQYRPLCVYWDESFGENPGWSSNGCSTSNDVTGRKVLCSCNHLTSFAILMDANPIPVKEKKSHLLYMTPYIGCGIALACLILTIIIHVYFKNLRNSIASKILVCVCISLAVSNLIFLVGMQPYATKVTAGCKTVAALLHYFLLTSVMWMGVEAFHVSVNEFKTYQTHFILKSSILAWGLPAVIVALTLGINNTDNYTRIAQVCWLSKTPFYAAFLAPVVVILLFTFTMFFLVICRIISMKSDKLAELETKTLNVFAISGLISLFMLSWFLAFIAVEEGDEAFQILFFIFNILLGMFVFTFYCICKKDARDAICSSVCKQKKETIKPTFQKH